MKNRNADKLADILADNWVGLGWNGKRMDKAKSLADLKSPGNSLDNIEMGHMTVRIFGNTSGNRKRHGKEHGRRQGWQWKVSLDRRLRQAERQVESRSISNHKAAKVALENRRQPKAAQPERRQFCFLEAAALELNVAQRL